MRIIFIIGYTNQRRIKGFRCPTKMMPRSSRSPSRSPGPWERRPRTTSSSLPRGWPTLNSEHSRRNFELTPRRFLDELEAQALALRTATVEDVRDAINAIAAGKTLASARQAMLRVKSLLSYGHRLGYLRFNAGAVLSVSDCAWSLARKRRDVTSKSRLLCAEVRLATHEATSC